MVQKGIVRKPLSLGLRIRKEKTVSQTQPRNERIIPVTKSACMFLLLVEEGAAVVIMFIPPKLSYAEERFDSE